MIRRDIHDEIIKYLDSPDALVITGMRRVGKTTLLKQIHDEIPSSNKVYIDLENPQNRKPFETQDYDQIKANLALNGLDFSQKTYIFLDEIQQIPNLPSIAKYLIDNFGVKFFLTGSASFYFKNLFSESLAGRKFIFELFPLSFKEFLRFKAPNLKLPDSEKEVTEFFFEKIMTPFKEYLFFGGFPGVVARNSTDEKNRALDDIFTAYFQFEVERLGDFQKTRVLRDLLILLMQRVGSKLSISKIAGEMGVSRQTLASYVSFFEQTYFLNLVRPFSKNPDTEIRKAPKVYFCDTGLLNRFVNLDSGRILENTVFNLLKLKGQINYYQKKSGVEIDFILDKKGAFEVKQKPDWRDFEKLSRLSETIGISNRKIVLMEFSKLDNFIPAFLL